MSHSRKRILVVEDEPLVAMLLEDMLLDLGHDVIGPALRYDKALELARSQRLDAAILDVNLGDRRSYPIGELLLARKIPFAFVTGYGSPGFEWEARIPLLRKPFEQDALHALVGELLQGSR